MQREIFDLLIDKIDSVEKKVDGVANKTEELLQWKWYFTGVAAVVGVLTSGIVSIAAWIMQK
jgi:ElaB/YqjD/DUF883 family membrane-anchored ribosome-binding protein